MIGPQIWRSFWTGSRFSPRQNRLVRFLLAGGANTLFGYLVFALVQSWSHQSWLALLVGTLAGIVFNFFTTGGYVFRQLTPGRILPFVLVYLAIYAVNLGLLTLLAAWIGNRLLAQFCLLVPMAALSYLLMAKLVFPDRVQVSSPEG